LLGKTLSDKGEEMENIKTQSAIAVGLFLYLNYSKYTQKAPTKLN